jgi:undecaprenyl phosphate-alpha-L-ara4N flippase subunit ArnE
MAFSDKKIGMDNLFQIIFGVKFISGMVLYSFGFLLWLYILSKYDLNVALPIAQSLFFVVTIAGSFFFLQETLNFQHIIGIGLCLLGILLIAVK